LNFSRKPVVPIPEELTVVWKCSQDGCNGWMRDKFSFANKPLCPLCSSAMEKDTKMLPIV
jgi:hypothetical protein